MVSIGYLRKQADVCSQLANATTDANRRRAYHTRALEFLAKAIEVELAQPASSEPASLAS
jgi:hypothetical protein